MNSSGGIETADVAVRVAWVCGVAVRRSVGPPAVALVVAASRRRLYDIAALIAPWSVAPFPGRSSGQWPDLVAAVARKIAFVCVVSCGVELVT